ncbi:MAG: hypothetical protein ABJL56_01925, partial [Nitratireductor sp.]
MRIRSLIPATLFVLVLLSALPAAAQVLAPATIETVEAASRLTKGDAADLAAARRMLEDGLDALAPFAHADRYVLAAAAASVARLAGDFERSQVLFATA